MSAVGAFEADADRIASETLERLLAVVLETPPMLRAPLRRARILALRSLLPRVLARSTLPDLLVRLSSGARRLEPAAPEEVERAEREVDRWLRPRAPLATTCLYRALVRYVLLRELGVEVSFVMGVRAGGGELVGHAWLERHGAPVREALDHAYARTYRHPEPAERGPAR